MRRMAHIIIIFFLLMFLMGKFVFASEAVLSKKEVARGSFFTVKITDAPLLGNYFIKFQKKTFQTFQSGPKTQSALIPVAFDEKLGKAEVTIESSFEIFVPREIEVVKGQAFDGGSAGFFVPSEQEKKYFDRVSFPVTTLVFFSPSVPFREPFFKRQDRTDVFAAEDGIIRFSGNIQGFGKTVILDHGQRFFSVYTSLEEILVKESDAIPAGFRIGKSDPGKARFGVVLYGTWLDPKEFFTDGGAR